MARRSRSCSATVHARWRTARAELALLAGLVALLGAPRSAGAELRLKPASDGSIGAFLVADAPARAGAVPRGATRGAIANPGGSARFELLASGDAAIDLERALRRQQGARAWLATTLELESDARLWLLTSIDGATTVYVDGAERARFSEPRLRGNSWDALALDLARGRHELVLELAHPGKWWAAALRIVDREQPTAPRGLTVVLPGVDEDQREALTERLLRTELSATPTATGWVPTLGVRFDRGAPLDTPLGVTATLGEGELTLGAPTLGARGVEPLVATLPIVRGDLREDRYAVKVAVAGVRRELRLILPSAAPAALARARDATAGADPALAATLAWCTRELNAAAAGSPYAVATATRALESAVDALLRGRAALDTPGVHDHALPSPVDGRPDPIALHVPAGFARASERRYPLAILLHGLDGTPRSVMRAFLAGDGDAPRLPGFVLAPHAHGNAFYRGVGEAAVMSALDWALATFPIDPDRVTITGVSMGGTGAAYLALRYPERFAAMMPLCGYHSWFIRRDTSNRPLASWEPALMAHWSPASWAPAGRDLPLYLAQGTQDHPKENGKTLVEAYRKQGYAVTEEWPDIGHNVYDEVWKGRRQWPMHEAARRVNGARRITLFTDSLRYARRGFVEAVDVERPGAMLRVDATLGNDGGLAIETENVAALRLWRDRPPLSVAGALVLDVDGAKLTAQAGSTVELLRRDGAWQIGAAAAPQRVGPIADALIGAVRYVWGSGDPRTALANQEVARALARRWSADARPSIESDLDLDPTAPGTWIFVGTPEDHRELAALRGRLPVEGAPGRLTHGSERVARGGVGAIFASRDPRAPGRTLVVVTGTDAAGIWRALSLPTLLPDYLVYDERLRLAAAEQVLSGAAVIAGGFFDRSGRLP